MGAGGGPVELRPPELSERGGRLVLAMREAWHGYRFLYALVLEGARVFAELSEAGLGTLLRVECEFRDSLRERMALVRTPEEFWALVNDICAVRAPLRV